MAELHALAHDTELDRRAAIALADEVVPADTEIVAAPGELVGAVAVAGFGGEDGVGELRAIVDRVGRVVQPQDLVAIEADVALQADRGRRTTVVRAVPHDRVVDGDDELRRQEQGKRDHGSLSSTNGAGARH